MNCLLMIKGVTRRNRIRNADIRIELNIGMDVIRRVGLQRCMLRYFGHVTRMKADRLPNIALFDRVVGQTVKEKRMPEEEIERQLEEDLGEMGQTIVDAWRLAASDRDE